MSSKKSKKEPKEEELIHTSEKAAREVKHGESVGLTQAANDSKYFEEKYEHLYVLGMEFMAKIPLKKLKVVAPD